ncbi:hypothetical protein CYMTET_17631 [Cymbomonas tetramitiformis]|uniref:DUF659 domain-containing protein n=1 Tax=Cymbomonas tetramitiformis TaxID=36881 RepID=A0AAE0L730_9CHLO|nr:hypothetical protein CYMTET_17631 [Cymbomonas tetramitiformis]
MKVALQTVAKVGDAYTTPDRRRVSGPMLQQERNRVHAEVVSFRGPVERFGSTVVSDGATDGAKRPVNNLLDVSPECVEFILAKDCTGHTKDKKFIANQVTGYIWGQPDPFKTVQVLMDNATRGSWPPIEEECPWVVVGPCEPHVGSLEIGDFCKLPFFKERATPESATLLEQFQEVQAILGDLFFPAQIDMCLAFLRPVVLLLRFSDSDLPTASKIQYYKFEVQEALKAVNIDPENPPWDMDAEDAPCPEALKQEIVSIHRYRWDYGYTILQRTGYLLDPECVDMDQHEDEETMESFRRFVEKTYYYPKQPGPDASAEEVAAFKVQCASQLAKRSAAEVQLLQYKMKRGVFARETVWDVAKVVSTPDFWFLFGNSVKELQLVGMRATAQVSGAAAKDSCRRDSGSQHSSRCHEACAAFDR